MAGEMTMTRAMSNTNGLYSFKGRAMLWPSVTLLVIIID